MLTSEPIKDAWPKFFANIPTLNAQHIELCEGEITFEEAAAAVKQMADDKSPGSDGLPAEFYKMYFQTVGPSFIQAINSGIRELSPSQRFGYITLLCKNEEKSSDLNNWRPISLLNTDYKILSKTLCNRLKLPKK